MQVLEITIFYKQCIVELGSLQWTNGLVSPWLKNMHLLVYMDTTCMWICTWNNFYDRFDQLRLQIL